MEINHPILGNYKLIKKIGRGAFASVFLAKHVDLKYPIAIKIFKEGSDKENIKNSFNITKTIMHPFICQDFDLMQTPKGEDCVLMEYIEGKTLLEYANQNAPLSMNEIQTIFGQLVIAIDFLHKHQIIHRDLKCENIMIDKFKNIRLIDLSFSCNNIHRHSTLCGSPAYIAPEIINNKYYGTSVDVWSLGIVLYAITYGKLPFENQNYSLLFHLISSSEPTFQKDERVSDSLIDLIKKLLIKDPQHRISINEIKQHPFFVSDSDGTSYTFSDQHINSFVREPNSKTLPEIQILKQMGLSTTDSVNAVNEIKSGKVTFNSKTYEILYKNFVSKTQMPSCNRCFLCPVGRKFPVAKTSLALPLMIDIEGINKEENLLVEQRLPSTARFQLNQNEKELTPPLSPAPPRENLFAETKQIGLPMFLNSRVQFRRFSTNARTSSNIGTIGNIGNIRNIGTKRSCFNLRNFTLASQLKINSFDQTAKRDFSVSANALPQLDQH